MSKRGQGIKRLSIQSSWGTFTNSFQSKRILWLAGMLAFFLPTIAAGAWYVSSADNASPAVSASANSINTEASSKSANASSTVSSESGSESNSSVHATTSSAANSGEPAKTEVTVNGKKIDIPSGGANINAQIDNEQGSSSVSISVDSQNTSSGSNNGSASTHIHSNSSTHTNSNNNTSTSFFNSFSSSP